MISNLRVNAHNKYMFDAKFTRMQFSQKFVIENYDKNLNQLVVRSKNRFGYISLNSGLIVMSYCYDRISKEFLEESICDGKTRISMVNKNELKIFANVLANRI